MNEQQHARGTLPEGVETGLLEASHLFRDMLDSLPAAIYTTDADGRLTYFNPAAAEFSGRTPELGTDQWCVSWKLYYPDGRPMPHDECPMAIALKEGRAVTGVEAIAERLDGRRIWFEPYPSPLWDNEGQLIGGINMLVDITDRRRAEEQLRRNERDLADLFENASEAIHWVGPDGTILRANRAELELLGYTRDEYLGRHIADFHVDEAAIEDILRRLASTEELHNYEARLRCKDRSIRNVLISSNVLWENGEFIHTRCFTRDITERKQSDYLRSLLAAIIEGSDDAIISKNLDGVITSWNAGAERLFGYTAQEAVGQSVTILIPAERLGEEHQILQKIRRGERVDHFETVRLRKDGTPLDISLTVSPVRDSTGQIVGASKTARDITEQKRAEERERRILEEAQAARLEAEKANREKAAFLAIMSHELRTPLNAIIGFSQLLDTEVSGPLNEKQKVQVERIAFAARHLLRIIDEILTFSRIEAGREEVQLEATDLAELAREACSLVEPLAAQKDLGFLCNAPERLEMETDPGKVRQILLNLLSNAVKFTDHGEVRLEVCSREGDALIRVSDTGIGIPPEHLDRIFEPFSRIEQPPSRRKDGTGLGLRVSKRLAELLNGSVDVESTPGEGTMFTLRLPLGRSSVVPDA